MMTLAYIGIAVSAIAAFLSYRLYRREKLIGIYRPIVEKEIAKLPGWQPEILRLHGEGYTYLEVAGLIQMPKDFVLTEMCKGMATLRMQLNEIEDPEAKTTWQFRALLYVMKHVKA